MRKFFLYLIPIITLIAFIALMIGGNFLKQPFGKNDRVYEGIKALEMNVNQEQWDQANEEIIYIEHAWKKVVNRIQFSVEREYMFEISGTIARIHGGIVAKDKTAILEEIYFFYDLWLNLAR